MNIKTFLRWLWIVNGVLLALALLHYFAGLSHAFTDSVSCTVQGKVYKLTAEEIVTFAPGSTCTGLRVSADDRQLVIYSPYHWVTVPIGIEKGWRMFQYRWGAEVAHLGAETVPVRWRPVERG